MIKKKILKKDIVNYCQILLRYVCNNKHTLKKLNYLTIIINWQDVQHQENLKIITVTTPTLQLKDFFHFILHFLWRVKEKLKLKSCNPTTKWSRADFVTVYHREKISCRYTYIYIIVINKYITKIFKYKRHNYMALNIM